MNKNLIITSLIFLLTISCTKKAEQTGNSPVSDFSNSLTQKEIEGKKLTPEILWKFGRLGEAKISPDGNTLVLTITRYDANTNKSNSEIYLLPVTGGELKKV